MAWLILAIIFIAAASVAFAVLICDLPSQYRSAKICIISSVVGIICSVVAGILLCQYRAHVISMAMENYELGNFIKREYFDNGNCYKVEYFIGDIDFE